MDAIENLLSRNSPRELTTPIPSKADMSEVYQAALRAPDHAWLRPSRFIEVTGKGLDKLSELYADFASMHLKDITPIQLEKYKSAPYRAPMVIVLVTKVSEHPKVPEVAAAQNILLALHAKNYAGIWRTGKLAFNQKMVESFNLSPEHRIIGYLYVGTPTGTMKTIPSLNLKNFITHWE
jgi:nitroreductase